jgi:hypothetical protein
MKRGLWSVALLAPLALLAQEFRGTISGSVTDEQGAAIASVKILATEVRTGTKTETVSDSTGQYTLPFLAPGDYAITAEVSGFKGYEPRD